MYRNVVNLFCALILYLVTLPNWLILVIVQQTLFDFLRISLPCLYTIIFTPQVTLFLAVFYFNNLKDLEFRLRENSYSHALSGRHRLFNFS